MDNSNNNSRRLNITNKSVSVKFNKSEKSRAVAKQNIVSHLDSYKQGENEGPVLWRTSMTTMESLGLETMARFSISMRMIRNQATLIPSLFAVDNDADMAM